MMQPYLVLIHGIRYLAGTLETCTGFHPPLASHLELQGHLKVKKRILTNYFLVSLVYYSSKLFGQY